MTKASIKEYAEAVRWRYLKSSKREKGTILNEFTKVTGYLPVSVKSAHRFRSKSATLSGNSATLAGGATPGLNQFTSS